ncbi:MAG: F-type H+-transporting ATPase subunit b [Puniceicoccaceae bacterium 5H]|nr:MAG: F-type H+-transporting ATPase subunit b [Puniceicoccaceae bacterium 5H]
MFNTILLAATEAGHAAAGHAAEAGASHEGIVDSIYWMLTEDFGLNGPAFIAQVINFLVVMALLWYFAYKPVVRTIDERQKKISDGIQFAEESKRQLAETEKRQAETLREANAEAQRILHEARERSSAYEEEQRAKVAGELAEMRRRAEESIRLEREKSLSEIRQEVARLVVLTSSKVLRSELTEEQKARLNQSATEQLAARN